MIISELQVQIIKQLKENPEINLNQLLAGMGGRQAQQKPILMEALAGLTSIFGGQLIAAENDSDKQVALITASNVLLDDKVIWQQMTSQAQGIFTNCQLLLSIDSTNKRIKSMPAGSLLLAEQQTGGRGRYGRSWLSPFASGIYLSISLERVMFTQGVGGLSLAIGVILARCFNELGINIGLKWPNDLLLSINPVSKLGGVLVELSDEEVIIGMGVNYCDSKDTDNAENKNLESMPDKQLATIEGIMQPELLRVTNRSLVTAMMINHLAAGLEGFFNMGFAAYQEEWNALNILANTELSVDTGAKVLQGICRGVDGDGRLLLSTNQNDKTHSISSGSIILNNH